eukprot:scaffold8374_cov175-Amphora_coffeaeformis.AAC.33
MTSFPSQNLFSVTDKVPERKKTVDFLKSPLINNHHHHHHHHRQLHSENYQGKLESFTDANAGENENEVGWFPLQIACREGFTDLVALFINHRADVNTTSRSHQTPLQAAASNGH